MSYVLPDRKAFVDSITRIFLKYRQKDEDGKEKKGFELASYQKLVRDYLLIETPYRGLLVYHGLGSGKTCSAIAVAESLMTTKKVYVLLPASLADNFLGEIRTCGDPVYKKDSHWVEKSIRTSEDRDTAKSLGISDEYLDKNGRYFMTVKGAAPNFQTLSRDQQKGIDTQIDDLINSRFNFINYNGVQTANFDKLFPSEHMFDDSVVIIDEAHDILNNLKVYINYHYLWLISATYEKIVERLKKTSSNSLIISKDVINNYINFMIVKNNIKFIKNSFKLPEPVEKYYLCKLSNNINVIKNFISDSILEKINANN
jgi:hypothetical protein